MTVKHPPHKPSPNHLPKPPPSPPLHRASFPRWRRTSCAAACASRRRRARSGPSSSQALFLWGIGGSRVFWLVIGLITLLRPDWLRADIAFRWLTVLIILFSFIHAAGSPAWLSWIADLVPAKLQGRYWSLRQVGCAGACVLARLASGYYLDAHRNPKGYALLFLLAAVIGIADALMFLGVAHRRPKRRVGGRHVIAEFAHRLRVPAFRRLCGVYLLWSISNCLIGPTCYYFMRDQVKMGVVSFAVVEAICLTAYTVFSFLWGRYSDHHGHRGPLVLCLLLHSICPIFYFLAGPHDAAYVAVCWTIGAMGFSGINLFMWPLVIRYTKVAGAGREMGMAAFNVVLGLASFLAFMVADRAIYDAAGYWVGGPGRGPRACLAIMAVCMVLRLAAAGLAYLLPQEAADTTPEAVIKQIVTTSPLRAGLSFVMYITGQEVWQELGDDDEQPQAPDAELAARLKNVPLTGDKLQPECAAASASSDAARGADGPKER
ncbi:MAG: MFS transporter [Planctomycetota bacterium]|nr:MFS transporter [Planctomycetota bacterium]